MKEKLKFWADKTAQAYVHLAESNDLAFYQQTPLNDITEPVKVVVMGINPGSGGSYTDQKANEVWALNREDATGEHLLAGNKEWAARGTWRFWQKTKRLLSEAFPVERFGDNDIIYTNATFFNTKKANQLPKGLLEETLPYTIDLIDILSPQLVVALSGSNCFGILRTKYGNEFAQEKVFGNMLIIGRLHELTYVGIYHPASFYTNPQVALVKKSIKIIKDNLALSLSEMKEMLQKECGSELLAVRNYRPAPNVSYDIAQEVMHLIANRYDVLEKKQDAVRLKVNPICEAVVVAQKRKQHVYWRHIDYNGKIHYDNPNANYCCTAEFLQVLGQFGYEVSATCLGVKNMRAYNGTSAEDLCNQIMTEIKEISVRFDEVLSSK